MCFKFLTVIFILLLSITHANASTYLPIDDEIYNKIYRLEAEGVIQSGLLTTRPLSYMEIARLLIEAEKNSDDKSLFIKSLVKYLKDRMKDEIGDIKFIKPVDFSYGRYLYADSDIRRLYYNDEGDHFEKGSNIRFGFSHRTELGFLSLYINPEIRYSEKDTDFVLKRSYGVLSFLGLDLQFGKDSQWWGPGYHGAIILSNNPEPLTMLRLSNPHPVLLPWIFKYLGLFRFTFFVTRLEEERSDFPEPYFWGMRLNLKPHPYLEIGLHRTALLGGKGRSEDISTWWKSFTGAGEHQRGSGAGDQRAGYDIKLTLPLRFQPIQLYLEIAGEDIPGGGGFPTRTAKLMGVYLPRIFDFERTGLRAEYATTHVTGKPNVWYTHSIYKAGYKYKGRIIGHHMGTDSKDAFFELSYLIPGKDRKVSIFYDREEHNLSGTVRERKDEYAINGNFRLKKDIEVVMSYQFGRFRNFGNVRGAVRKINILTGMIGYTF